MPKISQSVVKSDHQEKMSGRALFADDYPRKGGLTGVLLRSEFAAARILAVVVPPLPPGYFYVDQRAVPAAPGVRIVEDDLPVFAHQ